jgi:hypothetical protein
MLLLCDKNNLKLVKYEWTESLDDVAQLQKQLTQRWYYMKKDVSQRAI